MGTTGDWYDNAMAESWFATLKREGLPKDRTLLSDNETKSCVIHYIEGFYNIHRIHSALGYRSPSAYEAYLKAA